MDDDEEPGHEVRAVAKTKSGIELYRELLRHYPAADIEDYYRAGMWRNDKLRSDILLIEAHRREAGAPDPLPLDEVPMPQLPQCPWAAITPAMPKAFPMPTIIPGPKAAGHSAAAGLIELRAAAIFVAKWRLDPVRAKHALARLAPDKRRLVISGFTTEHTIGGPAAFEDLEKYINKLDETAPLQDSAAATAAVHAVPPAFAKVPGMGGVLPPAISAAASAEMRVITLFVVKFKLDPMRTKALLLTVPASRRSHVMQTFSTTLTGTAATEALELYIKDAGEAGMKRPLSAIGGMESGDLKRSNMTGASCKKPSIPFPTPRLLAP